MTAPLPGYSLVALLVSLGALLGLLVAIALLLIVQLAPSVRSRR